MNPTEIIKSSKIAEEILAAIRHKEKCTVMFVDLVGSTEFKANNPDEFVWLKRLAIFLDTITQIIEPNGRVVKYIGDEIMAVFDGEDKLTQVVHTCENILEFCAKSPLDFRVKIGVEYGNVSLISFGSNSSSKRNKTNIPADPQGIVVDKCARIMHKALPNTIICSDGFFQAYIDKERWRFCGHFEAKGIKSLVDVYQLKTAIVEFNKIIISQHSMSLAECEKRVKELEEMIKELKSFH